MFGRDEIIDEAFEKHPELLKKGVFHVANWFFILGELESSAVMNASIMKVAAYRKHLGRVDPKLLEKLDKEWESLNEV